MLSRVVFFLWCFLSVSVAWCETRVLGYGGEPPGTLWRWTHANVYLPGSETTSEFARTDQFPFPQLAESWSLPHYFPELRGKAGLFTWTSPIGGMAASPIEIYGDTPVRFRISSDSRILRLQSDIVRIRDRYGEFHPDAYTGKLDLTNVDLIEHHVFSADLELYREWVILDPKCILEATADPDILRPVLLQGLAHLKDPNFKFKPDEMHSLIGGGVNLGSIDGKITTPLLDSPEERKVLIPILEHYLASPPPIDPIWKRWINPNVCRALLKRRSSRPIDRASAN